MLIDQMVVKIETLCDLHDTCAAQKEYLVSIGEGYSDLEETLIMDSIGGKTDDHMR